MSENQVTVGLKDFATAVKIAGSICVTSKFTRTQAHSLVQLSVVNEGLSVCGVNDKMFTIAKCPQYSSGTLETIYVNKKDLTSAITKISGKSSSVVLTTENGLLKLLSQVGSLTIAMHEVNFPSFPTWPDCPVHRVDYHPAHLERALSYVLKAASTDQGRPNLMSICFELGYVVATDGHRLHMVRVQDMHDPFASDGNVGPFVLPSATMVALRNAIRAYSPESVQGFFARNTKNSHVAFSFGEGSKFELGVLPDSSYPKYRSLPRTEHKKQLRVSRDELLNVLAMDLDKKKDPVTIQVQQDNKIRIFREADNEGGGLLDQTITGFYKSDDAIADCGPEILDAKPFCFALNPKYLKDILDGWPATEVEMLIDSELLHIQFETVGGDQTVLLMPTKI